VLRDIDHRLDRDERLAELVEAASEKGQAGLDNPAAAWQKWVNDEFRPALESIDHIKEARDRIR